MHAHTVATSKTRATRALNAGALAACICRVYTAEHRQRLKTLFSNELKPVDLPDADGEPLQVEQEHLLAALSSLEPMSSGGPSGPTQGHLSASAVNPHNVEQVQCLFTKLFSGAAPYVFWLLDARLVPLPKPAGGVQPILVQEVITRLVSSCAPARS